MTDNSSGECTTISSPVPPVRANSGSGTVGEVVSLALGIGESGSRFWGKESASLLTAPRHSDAVAWARRPSSPNESDRLRPSGWRALLMTYGAAAQINSNAHPPLHRSRHRSAAHRIAWRQLNRSGRGAGQNHWRKFAGATRASSPLGKHARGVGCAWSTRQMMMGRAFLSSPPMICQPNSCGRYASG